MPNVIFFYSSGLTITLFQAICDAQGASVLPVQLNEFLISVDTAFITAKKKCITFVKKRTMIKYGYTILYVKQVSASIEFYEKAFGLQRRFIAPEGTYAELQTGDTILSFAAHELANSNLKNGYLESSIESKTFGIEIGFTTDNVENTVKSAIAAGAKLEAPAKTKPWGQTVAYVRDPDGFLIEICTAMAD